MGHEFDAQIINKSYFSSRKFNNKKVKNITIILVVIITVLGQSCGLLNQAGEYERFVNSNFTLSYVEVVEIGGVDVSDIDNKAGLNVGDIMTLTGRMFSGGMPSRLKAYIKVENNTDEIAAISGMEWKLLMKDVEYANGLIDNRVEVKPHSSKTFPVKADVDLLKVLQSESLPQILKVVFNINDVEEVKKLGIELKIKPYYKSGTKLKKYPGYISLKP